MKTLNGSEALCVVRRALRHNINEAARMANGYENTGCRIASRMGDLLRAVRP